MILQIKATMLRKLPAFFAATILLLAASCQHTGTGQPSSNMDQAVSDTSSAKGMTDQLMAMHEQAMGKIGTLRKLEGRIRQKIDSIGGKDTMSLSKLAAALNSSDTAMFGWMSRYQDQVNAANDSLGTDKLRLHLQEVKQINARMDSAIQRAQEKL